MRSFRELKVWQKSHAITLDLYQATASFPKHELYGLTSQLRRSAASVPQNVVEGCGRGGGLDFARFLQIALGSASETEYHILLASDLGYLESEIARSLEDRVTEVKRMLSSLIQKVRHDSASESWRLKADG